MGRKPAPRSKEEDQIIRQPLPLRVIKEMIEEKYGNSHSQNWIKKRRMELRQLGIYVPRPETQRSIKLGLITDRCGALSALALTPEQNEKAEKLKSLFGVIKEHYQRTGGKPDVGCILGALRDNWNGGDFQ